MITSLVNSQKNYADLNNGILFEIMQHIDFIHELLMRASIPTRPYTAKAVETLLSMDNQSHRMILGRLKSWKNILISADIDLDNVDEIVLANKALEYFNFRLKDYNWETTARDEIIEIYNPEGIQLYRSLNFFKTCGYSLLDLCVNEWYILWERPKSIVEKMHKVVGELLSGKKADHAMNVEPHLIRETYDDGTTQPFYPRTAVVEFGNIYPLYSNGIDKANGIIGFVVTSRGKLISVGDDAMKLAFI